MSALDLYDGKPKAKRKAKSLLEKIAELAGADKSRALPRDTSAYYKLLLNAKLSTKHSR